MADFWELLKESVITQAFITILAISATVYMWVAGHAVPPELYTLDSLVIGFYFGGKMGFYQGMARGLRNSADAVPDPVVAPPSPK